jgi:hypothetical protein
VIPGAFWGSAGTEGGQGRKNAAGINCERFLIPLEAIKINSELSEYAGLVLKSS